MTLKNRKLETSETFRLFGSQETQRSPKKQFRPYRQNLALVLRHMPFLHIFTNLLELLG